ncbi:MAG TPA: hypothetical protein PKD61_15660, partial [Polyangiaceae bacterium]|nr:hypothetical protein [Polyangiaceae bacterium]
QFFDRVIERKWVEHEPRERRLAPGFSSLPNHSGTPPFDIGYDETRAASRTQGLAATRLWPTA